MIPSDHFVRFYNEVFKALAARGPEELRAYWRELGRLQSAELSERFRAGALRACHDYWERILTEENCRGELTLTDDYFELRMDACPSLAKVLDNDASPCELYCDHCLGWVEPTLAAAGLCGVHDLHSRTEPHCLLRVYTDPAKAEEFAARALLPAHPYDDPEVDAACRRARSSGSGEA